MKNLLLTLSSISTLTIAGNATLNTRFTEHKSVLKTINNITPQVSSTIPIFNSEYQKLNDSNWIANQSTTDHKYYSYDTSHAIDNLSDETPTRNAFLVDNNGNLTIDSGLNFSDADKSMLNNIQEQMNSHKQITTIKDSFNSYSKSIYSDSYFSGDNSSWKYLQFGGIENHIDISIVSNQLIK